MINNFSQIIKNNKIFIILYFCGISLSIFVFYTYLGDSSFRFPYHDALTYDYPNRFYISKSFNQGIIPLWDQWTNNGMPSSLNISFMYMSPIIFLFSIFGAYKLETLILEMFLMQIIAFTGMFFWLRTYTNKWFSLFGALVFSLAPPILTTPTNASVVCSMSMIPFIAYASKKTLQGSLTHTGLLSIFLIIIFTSGYLGLNILYLPVIFSFCFIEFILFDRKNKNILKGIFLFMLSNLLFLGYTSFGWLELWNYTRFNLGVFRVGNGADPFVGAFRIKALFTLFFTNNLPPYVPLGAVLPSAGNSYGIFIGTINLGFIIFSWFIKNDLKRTIYISIFGILVLFISLTPDFIFPVFASKILPFLNMTRWHGWYNLIMVFLLVTLSIRGLSFYFEDKLVQTKKLIISLSFIVLIMFIGIIKLLSSSIYVGDFFSIQLICLILAILFLYYNYKNRSQKLNKNLIIVILISLSLLELIPKSFTYLSYRDDRWYVKVYKDIKSFYDNNSNTNFNATYNNRKNTQSQLITGIPSPYGYSNLQTMEIFNLKRKVGESNYLKLSENIFYFPQSNNNPDKNSLSKIKIIKINPNNISLLVNNDQKRNSIIWSSAFTPSWKVFVNGHEKLPSRSINGFTILKLELNDNNIYLQYQPRYLNTSKILAILSIITIFYLVILGLFNKKASKLKLKSNY